MNKRILVLIFILSVCLACGFTEGDIPKGISKEISQNREISILKLSLLLSQEVYPGTKTDKYLHAITLMVNDIKKDIHKKDDPYYKIGLINAYLYKTKGFKYDMKDPGAKLDKNQFLTGYLDAKKGSCITMPLLYYIIARELDLPVYWVKAPDHFFCRYKIDDKNYINIETTCGGKVAPDISYIQDFKITRDELDKKIYMHNMTDRECAADLLCIAGLYYARKGKFNEALNYLNASTTLNSKNPLAYRFLSLVYKNMGQTANSKACLKKAKELGYAERER